MPPAAAAATSVQCARPITLATLEVRGSLAQRENYVRPSAGGTVFERALGLDTMASSTSRKSEMTTQAQTTTIKDSPGAQQWVYDFAEGSREMRDLSGGKGAGVAQAAIAAPRQTRL